MGTGRGKGLSPSCSPSLQRNQASQREWATLLPGCCPLGSVHWSSLIVLPLNRASPASGTLVLPSRLPRCRKVPPLTGVFPRVPFISPRSSALVDGGGAVVPFQTRFVNAHPLLAIMGDVSYDCPDLSDGGMGWDTPSPARRTTRHRLACRGSRD